MKCICPNCKSKVSLNKVFFSNKYKCKDCSKKISISRISRLKWIGPLLCCVIINELGLAPNSSWSILLSAIWLIIYPFLIGFDLTVVRSSN
ncbi:hypothetical protein [Halobacteriovorax sp. HLS]|uniref:hypothetical protein n=1 Tax=Halobacteriovorax sp. HLS TaxID=2234000 RepID=UPI000FD8D66B|nr:hypothetical protein [Halobacteriovorax sp. HLS]